MQGSSTDVDDELQEMEEEDDAEVVPETRLTLAGEQDLESTSHVG